jgi:hypothetical protein
MAIALCSLTAGDGFHGADGVVVCSQQLTAGVSAAISRCESGQTASPGPQHNLTQLGSRYTTTAVN